MAQAPTTRTLTTEFVTAKELLADSIKVVHGQDFRISLSHLSKIVKTYQKYGSSARPNRAILSDPFEFEVDPFINSEPNDVDINKEPSLDTPEEPQIPLLAPRPYTRPQVEIENHDEEENDSNWSEWEGFENETQPPTTTIPPPPVDSYDSRELALRIIQEWAQSHGYALRIRTSRKRHKNDVEPYFIYLECDHGGRNQPVPKAKNDVRLRKSSTRRIQCPFRCILSQPASQPTAQWTLQSCQAPNDAHNHGPSSHPTAHPIHRRNARKNRPEILSQIKNNKISSISARDTLSSLRTQFPEAPLTLDDIRNVYQEVKAAMNNGLSAVQAMISKLSNEYQFHYVLDKDDRLERVLFFHNESLQLLHLFPKSYVLDSTYRTNRFNLPLLDIVGCTATNRSFIIGQAFLTHEEEEDYIWVLRWIRDLYDEYNLPKPESITTDKAGGLHNACSIVWPDVPHLLCRWHINKDVKAYCQKHWLVWTEEISNQERKTLIDGYVKEFTTLWSQLVYAQTEPAYQEAVQIIQNRYHNSQPKISEYLSRVWLPFKETFVLAWTNKIRHFGNVDSSRAEGVHQAVKRGIGRNKAHLNDVVDHLSRYLNLHNRELRQELEYDCQKRRTDLQLPLYRKLHGHISYYALDEVEKHRRFYNLTLQNIEVSLDPCKQIFTTTKGLPCAHLLQQRILQHLPLEIADFDVQWRVDRLQELAQLPPLQKVVDPLTVRSRITKSQKRQLSLFEVIQNQVDSLSTTKSKGKGKDRAPRQPPSPQRPVQIERGESSRQDVEPIDIDEEFLLTEEDLYVKSDDEFYDSDVDPLGAELSRQRQAAELHEAVEAEFARTIYRPVTPPQAIQVRGWIHYEAPEATPPPTHQLSIPPLPSLPATPSLSPPAGLSPPTDKRQWSSVSPMTSPTKQRPQRSVKRPRRYRNSLWA